MTELVMVRPVVTAIAVMVLVLASNSRTPAQNTSPAQPAVLWGRTKDAEEAKRSQKSADDKNNPKAGTEAPAPQESQKWERAKEHNAPARTKENQNKQK